MLDMLAMITDVSVIDPSKPRYAGVGSRQTPEDVLQVMTDLGESLSTHWVLRSGHADGADMAFEEGAVRGKGEMEIFLPWRGFNRGYPGGGLILPKLTEAHFEIVRQSHPGYRWLPASVRSLHARNVCQVLGEDLRSPVRCVLCWTPEGKGGGGTGTAIRIARQRQISVFDFGLPGEIEKANLFLGASRLKDVTNDRP